MPTIRANEIWNVGGAVAVEVAGMTQYRIVFGQVDTHMTGPGVNRSVEWEDLSERMQQMLDDEEYELAAIVLVAQWEAGVLV